MTWVQASPPQGLSHRTEHSVFMATYPLARLLFCASGDPSEKRTLKELLSTSSKELWGVASQPWKDDKERKYVLSPIGKGIYDWGIHLLRSFCNHTHTHTHTHVCPYVQDTRMEKGGCLPSQCRQTGGSPRPPRGGWTLTEASGWGRPPEGEQLARSEKKAKRVFQKHCHVKLWCVSVLD